MFSNSIVVKSGGTGYETLMDGGRGEGVARAAAAEAAAAVEALRQSLALVAESGEVVASTDPEALQAARELLDAWTNDLNQLAFGQGVAEAEEAMEVVDGDRVGAEFVTKRSIKKKNKK